jgi:hypothetical protein
VSTENLDNLSWPQLADGPQVHSPVQQVHSSVSPSQQLAHIGAVLDGARLGV